MYITTLWNSLPLNIRESESLEVFKNSLKTHLFSYGWGYYLYVQRTWTVNIWNVALYQMIVYYYYYIMFSKNQTFFPKTGKLKKLLLAQIHVYWLVAWESNKTAFKTFLKFMVVMVTRGFGSTLIGVIGPFSRVWKLIFLHF